MLHVLPHPEAYGEILHCHLGNLSFQRSMASLGRSQRARLLSRHGYRNAALCSTCDLWLHSLPEVWFCSDWKRRHCSVDRRIVSMVVCALSSSEQEFRLIGGVSHRPAASLT
jgi:hypothetical protein